MILAPVVAINSRESSEFWGDCDGEASRRLCYHLHRSCDLICCTMMMMIMTIGRQEHPVNKAVAMRGLHF